MAIVERKTKKKNQTEDDSPEAVLARLAQLSERLDGVESGDTIEDTPSIEIEQSHPMLTEMLYIKGLPFPGLWIPNYPALMSKRGEDGSCGRPETGDNSPAMGWSCSSVDGSCAHGWNHVATMTTSYREALESGNYDMVLEWWESKPDINEEHVIQLYDGVSRETVNQVAVRDFTPMYREEYEKDHCYVKHSSGLVCTLHAGHDRYSHVAGDGRKILAVW